MDSLQKSGGTGCKGSVSQTAAVRRSSESEGRGESGVRNSASDEKRRRQTPEDSKDLTGGVTGAYVSAIRLFFNVA
jgi:hypothetical protein